MEIRALCIRLLMTIMILLGVQDQKVDAVSLRVVPNRLQFFEYEPVTFHCEGVDYCEVLHKFKGKIKSCIKTNKRTPTGSSCSIQAVYADNSGEYWYEPEGGRRSNIISLSVTAGPVILESPAIPVLMEETVTLSCRNKTHSSNFNSAEFYKNRRSIHKSSTGSMTIQTVFKSDEGRYKCSILGAGESPESWLNVTDSQNKNYKSNPDEEACHFSSAATRIISTILVSALLVAVGLYHICKACCKREAGTSRAMSSAGPRQPVAVDPFYSTKQQVAERELTEEIITSEGE
ncbi:low affinity immunoglobulin gamma Fc region receptor II isoform X3 [Oreochromis niloticus]|uniref:low affinity immunoglobulin gamma Fc region receptor II isoform X3 n=1 Tax=Oreochromis niloticus TaxID=8128 RepID=UPI000674225D|nr:low affinity immunoglobulin gamma Fc region receptor II isoform X3 [Oreochromis niloticus]CAI5660975.1 unnamed protein product [Mustela putorius furo]